MEDIGEWIFSNLYLMMALLAIPILLLFVGVFLISISRSRRKLRDLKPRRESLRQRGI